MALSNEWTKGPAPSAAREELNRMYAEAELVSVERMFKRLRRGRAWDMWFSRSILIIEALLFVAQVYLCSRELVERDWLWASIAGGGALLVGVVIWLLWRSYWRRQVQADETRAREEDTLRRLRARAGVTS